MTTIIAEIGSSPFPAWDFEPWCAAAAKAGADAVKVQLFRVDVIYPPHMREAMRPREFPRERLREFVICAHSYGLTAGASVFDADAVALAAEWCDWLKLAASQENNTALIDAVQVSTDKKVYRSISNLPGKHAWVGARVTTLYAIQQYPAPMVLSLWRLMQAARTFKANGMTWGWSSHTTGHFDCALAARLGASVIEKHMALSAADCEAPHSLLPDRFAAMVAAIRKAGR